MGCWSFTLTGSPFPLALLETLGRVAFVLAFGVLVLFVLVFQFIKARELYGNCDSSLGEARTNCPSCGARTPVGSETCDYCDEPIDG